ncbi:MAG TPA: cytochrome b/b6 domain-containing protein [Mycobacteriales bacterium]|jgi:formate dehydrogenase subunit gamma|nr:cytochrome b/b6 domain-containing protein [Mycobacteriales bacterium]
MNPPTSPTKPDAGVKLLRFTVPVRLIHAATGALMMVCIATAAVLYNGSLAVSVGHRYVVEQIHVWCGFALPVPLILGFASPSYRADLRRLNRFTSHDWHWLRSSMRRNGDIPVGKFNAGQKLNAALSAGSIGVLLATGIVMYFTRLTRLSWRSGATFLHDWFSLGLGLLVVGHVAFALKDQEAMSSMRRGFVSLRWARREHGKWAAELVGEADDEQSAS